jgi:rhodanese-related sulfurtransferase
MPTAITRARVQQLVADGAQVVDVLARAEYQVLHLPGAVNLPLRELGRRARPELAARQRPVIVYCHDSL